MCFVFTVVLRVALASERFQVFRSIRSRRLAVRMNLGFSDNPKVLGFAARLCFVRGYNTVIDRGDRWVAFVLTALHEKRALDNM